MTTLWIYGDSFAEDRSESWQWHQQLAKAHNIAETKITAQAGVANDWISTQIKDQHEQWQNGDRVLVIITQPNRQWWFEDRPEMGNIGLMWGHPWARMMQMTDQHRVDAVGYYINYLQRDAVDYLRCEQMVAWIQQLAQQRSVELTVIPAFEMPVDLSKWCLGNLTDVCNWEFVDERSRVQHYASIQDSRLNHLSLENHKWFVDKISQHWQSGQPMDLTQGSLRHTISY